MDKKKFRLYLLDQKAEGDPRKTLLRDLMDLANRRQSNRPVGLRPVACMTGSSVVLNEDELSPEEQAEVSQHLSSIEAATLLAWELVAARCERGFFSALATADELTFYADVAGVTLEQLAGSARDRVLEVLPARLAYVLAKRRKSPEGILLAKGLGAMHLGVFTAYVAPFTVSKTVGSFYPCFDIRTRQDELPDPQRTRVLLVRES